MFRPDARACAAPRHIAPSSVSSVDLEDSGGGRPKKNVVHAHDDRVGSFCLYLWPVRRWRFLVCGLVFLCLAGAAHAVPRWLEPERIPVSMNQGPMRQIAVDPAGNAVVVWDQLFLGRGLVGAAFRPAGSSGWESPVRLSFPGRQAWSPSVAIDRRGNVLAVWHGYQGESETLRVWASSRSTRTREWAKPIALSEPGVQAGGPQVAFDDAGRAFAVWTTADNIVSSVRTLGGDTWSKPVVVATLERPSPGGLPGGRLRLAVDGAGNAAAAWLEPGPERRVVASYRQANRGRWGAPKTLSEPGADAWAPDVGIGGLGEAVVVWARHDGATLSVRASSRTRATLGWSDPVDIAEAFPNRSEPGEARPQVAVDRVSNAVAVWRHAARDTVQAASKPVRSDQWGAPVDLEPAGAGGIRPRVAVDQEGNAVAAWLGWPSEVRTAVRPITTGAWGAATGVSGRPETASATAHSARVAVTNGGNAIVAWSSGRGLQSAAYDVSGPVVRASSTPATVLRNQSVKVRVVAHDALSGVRSIRWDFGDGTTARTARGRSLPHHYAKAGSYIVTLAATDETGNATELATRVTVCDGRTVGTARPDRIQGTRKGNLILAGPADDIVEGLAGDDCLYGNNGKDRLIGNTGHDALLGGRGRDTLLGRAGNDTLRGGRGNDHIRGGAGDDTLDGGRDRDVLLGGDGSDTIRGGRGSDLIGPGAGRDVVDAGPGNDTVSTRDGTVDGLIDCGPGKDTLIADPGDVHVNCEVTSI